MSTSKQVKVIKAKESDRNLSATAETLRVAAYARVSTDHEEQLESFKSQITYFTEKINSNPAWTLVDIYADKAISGTGVEKREDFNRLITDCMAGKIDLVLTKSLSRFSRNTVDTLKYIRLLKERGVAINFEQEGINTADSTGELLITVLSAVSQQFVENLSESVKLGLRAKMLRGELVGDHEAIGYDKVEGKLVVNEKEADIVRYIFRRYLEGAGGRVIARELEALGYKTKRGNITWSESTVLDIIKNEKYVGDLVQGKTLTVDPITHRRIDNRGEGDLFYLENAHPAIVSKETFEKAQEILKRRNEWRVKPTAKNGNKYSRKHAFSCMIKCGFCGRNLTRRSLHSGTPHQKWVWQCSSYTKKGKQYCPECKAIDESIIEGAFVQGYNLLAGDNSDVLSEFLNRLENSLFTAGSAKRLEKITKQIKSYEARRQKLLDLLLDGTISQSDYAEKKEEIEVDLKPLYDEQKVLQEADNDEQRLKRQLKECKEVLQSNPILKEFDRRVFEAVIDHVVVGERMEDGTVDPRKIMFIYKAGIQPPSDGGINTCSHTRDNTR